MADLTFNPSFITNYLYVESVCSPQELDTLFDAIVRIILSPELPVLRKRIQPDKTTYYYNAPPFWINFRETYEAEIELLNVWLRP